MAQRVVEQVSQGRDQQCLGHCETGRRCLRLQLDADAGGRAVVREAGGLIRDRLARRSSSAVRTRSAPSNPGLVAVRAIGWIATSLRTRLTSHARPSRAITSSGKARAH